MTIRFMNCPHWSGAFIIAMLTSVSLGDLTIDDAIAVYQNGGEL